MSLENYRTSDFFITLSRTNTKLRDEYSSLDELIKAEDIDKEDFEKFFLDHGYKYNSDVNAFKEQD